MINQQCKGISWINRSRLLPSYPYYGLSSWHLTQANELKRRSIFHRSSDLWQTANPCAFSRARSPADNRKLALWCQPLLPFWVSQQIPAPEHLPWNEKRGWVIHIWSREEFSWVSRHSYCYRSRNFLNPILPKTQVWTMSCHSDSHLTIALCFWGFIHLLIWKAE